MYSVSSCRFFDFLFLLVLCRPLKQYPISTKRVVPAEIDKLDWAIDVSPYHIVAKLNLNPFDFDACNSHLAKNGLSLKTCI